MAVDLEAELSRIADLADDLADVEVRAIAALEEERDNLEARHPGLSGAARDRHLRELERRIGVHQERGWVLLRRHATASGTDSPDGKPRFPCGPGERLDPAFMRQFAHVWSEAARRGRLRIPGPLPEEASGEGSES
jgi:hypothetical protein